MTSHITIQHYCSSVTHNIYPDNTPNRRHCSSSGYTLFAKAINSHQICSLAVKELGLPGVSFLLLKLPSTTYLLPDTSLCSLVVLFYCISMKLTLFPANYFIVACNCINFKLSRNYMYEFFLWPNC